MEENDNIHNAFDKFQTILNKLNYLDKQCDL